MKLFTVGDSLSQGFMSLAGARTDLSYSTLIARAMGLKLGEEYSYPEWAAGGLPLNLEVILRLLTRRFGSDLSIFEALGVLRTIHEFASENKTYYETGAGSATAKASKGVEYFHNVSVQGFDVADAWLVTPSLCKREIDLAQNAGAGGAVSVGPSAAFYRTALKVLNPSLKTEYDDYSQLDWLRHHAESPDGVENIVLWLWANNALGTVNTVARFLGRPAPEEPRPAYYPSAPNGPNATSKLVGDSPVTGSLAAQRVQPNHAGLGH
jgi:hypothetical protein